MLTIYIVPRVVGNLVPKATEKSLGTRLGSLVVFHRFGYLGIYVFATRSGLFVYSKESKVFVPTQASNFS